ncbi:MAG TPA: hypothetical protein VLE21_05545 [Candidatus Nitrosocosmicus sp.]|nr:hypothetical protein [Candidatus Nitrosocosmicus sp.]
MAFKNNPYQGQKTRREESCNAQKTSCYTLRERKNQVRAKEEVNKSINRSSKKMVVEHVFTRLLKYEILQDMLINRV